MRSSRRQVSLGSKDEPSNPFKSPKKSTSPAKKSTPTPTRRGSPRAQSGPPAPPGGAKQTPPVAPSRTKSNSPAKKGVAPTPARAGKSVGLRKQSAKVKTDAQKRTDERARELIEASRNKVAASQSDKPSAPSARKEPTNPFKKNQSQRPKTTNQPRRGGRFNKRNKPQGPSKKVHKLHRGKYMEFKYDVRRILDDENVEDEHRSNVLGQTWAKGERQGVSDAKEFLNEKVAEGIITEKCCKRITKLIDSLTTRR